MFNSLSLKIICSKICTSFIGGWSFLEEAAFLGGKMDLAGRLETCYILTADLHKKRWNLRGCMVRLSW